MRFKYGRGYSRNWACTSGVYYMQCDAVRLFCFDTSTVGCIAVLGGFVLPGVAVRLVVFLCDAVQCGEVRVC